MSHNKDSYGQGSGCHIMSISYGQSSRCHTMRISYGQDSGHHTIRIAMVRVQGVTRW